MSDSTSILKASVRIRTALAAVTDPDSSRYNLGDVRAVQGADGTVWLSATDGRMAAVIPAEGFVDRPTMLPHEILPLKKKDFGRDGAAVTLNGKWESRPYEIGKPFAGSAKECPAGEREGRFPAMSDMFHPLPADVVLSINAQKLLKLAEAINDGHSGNPLGCVTLLIRRADDGTVTDAVRVVGDAGIGLIMPLDAERTNDLARYNVLSESYRAADAQARDAERAAKTAAEQPAQAPAEQPAPALKQRKRVRRPAKPAAEGVRGLVSGAVGY